MRKKMCVEEYTIEFTIPMNPISKPFRRCEECKELKYSVKDWEIHDNGLISHIHYLCCDKCLKEAKDRVTIKGTIII